MTKSGANENAMDELIAAAKEEGSLVVYGSCEEEYLAAACQNFQKLYGIKTDYQRLSTGEVPAKIEEENGKPSADVWFGGTNNPYDDAAAKGLLDQYDAINASHLTKDMYKDPNGYWYGIYTGLLGFMVNRDELERRDYRVVLTRETNDTDISNIERAAVAEREEADVFLRIHANGSDSPYVSGAIAICMTPGSPFNPELYPASRTLSDCVLEAFTAATGARNSGVWETNSMTGINWSRVPVTILEMGYMTNPAEDLRMATPEYRAKMAAGIADGIDRFFELTMAQ